MEQNKVRSYFLYAIGEILLVVVGILIALQVNNWNEKRQKLQIKQEYTLSMISDLQLDIQNIEDFQSYTEEQLSALDTLGTIIQTQVKEIKDIRELKFVPNLIILSNLNNSTYMALISSGNIDLYRKEIRDELIRHHGEQQQYLQWYENNTRVFYETMNAYLQSAPVNNARWIPPDMQNELWDDLDYSRYLMSFNALLSQRKFLLLVYQENYKELKISTEQLIRNLEVGVY